MKTSFLSKLGLLLTGALLNMAAITILSCNKPEAPAPTSNSGESGKKTFESVECTLNPAGAVFFDKATGNVWSYTILSEYKPIKLFRLVELGKPLAEISKSPFFIR